jgi:hypothetical protein
VVSLSTPKQNAQTFGSGILYPLPPWAEAKGNIVVFTASL